MTLCTAANSWRPFLLGEKRGTASISEGFCFFQGLSTGLFFVFLLTFDHDDLPVQFTHTKKKKKQATIKCVDIAGIIGLPYVPSKSDVALYTNLTTYL